MSRPKRTFTLEQEEMIVRCYTKDGESISSIAEVLGTTRPVVSRILHQRGVEVRWHQQSLTPKQEAEALRRFENGESYLSMESLFGIDRKTISATIRRRGGEPRSKGRRRIFESKEEWLRECMHARRKLEQLGETVVRLETTIAGVVPHVRSEVAGKDGE